MLPQKTNKLAYAIYAALAMSISVGAHAQSQNESSASQQEAAQTQTDETRDLDTIVVTGSRIRRAEIEGPAPVTVITSEQLQREGFSTVYEALNTLTQASGSTQNELFQNGFTPNASVINLRGLGPGRTLVLINGRRAADYPLPYNGQSNFVNFGNIPSAAVERIEVLAGGASAIYGSDAVAGVVNVILKKNYEGDMARVAAETTERGGGQITDFQWIGGKTGDNWSLTYTFQKYHQNPLYAYQRDFMDSTLDNPLPPEVVGIQPIGTMRLRNRTRTTNNYIAPPPGACEQFGDEWVRWNFRSLASNGSVNTLGESCGTFNDVGYQNIRNRNDDLSTYMYGTYDFSGNLRGWASLQAFKSTARSGPGTQFWAGPTAGAIWFDPQYNTFVDAQRVFVPSESGGVESLSTKYKETSFDLAVGLNGRLGEKFDWDATLSHARYDTENYRPRFNQRLINDWFLGPQLGVRNGFPIYNLNLPRYYAALTPSQFNQLGTIVETQAESKVTQGSFVLSGDLFELPAGTVGFAGLLEGASQAYDLHADPRILPTYTGPDRIYNLTGTGGGGERDRYAVGVEFSIPILNTLTMSIAGRYDKYDDATAVDEAKTWNAGLQWRPISNLLVRGSYATSFRAPDMHFVFAERSGSFSTVFDTRRCLESGRNATQCTSDTVVNYTAFGVRQGTLNLEEEAGKSWTAGFVWDIRDGLSITADYYSIELEGAVADITTAYILDGEAGCVTGLTRNRQPFTLGGPGSAFCQDMLSRVSRISAPGTTQDGQISEIRRGPINRAYLSTEGIDASLTYRLNTDRLGAWKLDVSYNHVLDQKTAQFSGDPVDSYRDDLTNFDFRSRVRSTLQWNMNSWDATLFMFRYGSLPNWQETGRIAPYFIWNANVGKKFGEKTKLILGVNNVFDKLHPKDEGFNTYPYFWRAYSPIGRAYFAAVEYKFN